MDLFEDPQGQAGPSGRSRVPLATRMRPQQLEEFIGQEQLLGKGMLLRRMIEEGVLGSVVFYGPPSSGKTTLAGVIANEINAKFLVLNAVLEGVKELKMVVEQARMEWNAHQRRTLLFVDEIHRWNKAQQDALLPHLESGLLTLIGATTENPFYALVGPLLSRCQLFELQPYAANHLLLVLRQALSDPRGLGFLQVTVDDEALDYLSQIAGGDMRNALNALESVCMTATPDETGIRHVGLEQVQQALARRVFRFNKTGDEHYHYASALIKSMRGSDPDAALYWLVAAIESGEDPNFIFRRLGIFCSEDIGLADPGAAILIQALHETYQKTGMPEGWYTLSHAVLYCALAPKSNSVAAVFKIIDQQRKDGIGPVPGHLRDKTANALKARYTSSDNPSESYLYPHDYPNHWVEQSYLPDSLKQQRWFEAGREGREAGMHDRLEVIRRQSGRKTEVE
jgi:putative ATPase